MRRFFNILSFYTLIFLHFLFLFFLLYSEVENPFLLTFTLFTSLFVILGYQKIPMKNFHYHTSDFILIFGVVLGATATFYLNHSLKFGPVIASAAIGLAGSFIPNFNKKSEILKELSPAIYCGSFLGMTAIDIAENFYFIIFGSLISGALFIISKNVFQGFGGKLGTLAFGGVVAIYVINLNL